jgi:hypothetical protein
MLLRIPSFRRLVPDDFLFQYGICAVANGKRLEVYCNSSNIFSTIFLRLPPPFIIRCWLTNMSRHSACPYRALFLATCLFFRQCAGARFAERPTSEGMEVENYFLIAPNTLQYEITLRALVTMWPPMRFWETSMLFSRMWGHVTCFSTWPRKKALAGTA